MHDYIVTFEFSLTLNNEYKVRFKFTPLPYITPYTDEGSSVPAVSLDRHQSFGIH
jgi:hypothetical protein